MNLHRVIKQVEKFTQDNSPLILTTVAAVGVVTTAYLSGQAGFKAALILLEEDAKRDVDDPNTTITLKENINLTWKVYLPAVGTGIITVAALVGANQIGMRRAAAMTTALAISERAFEEYTHKVVEKIGEKKANVIRDEVVQDRIDKDPLGDRQPIATGSGEVLCYEFYAGRYFYSSVEAIRKAENTINRRFNDGHETASLSDLYLLIGLESTQISDDVGWRADVSPLDINIVGHVSDKGQPCLGVIYRSTPIRDYWRFPQY